MRLVVGLVIAAAVAAFGALVLGEYDLSGTTGWIAGVLFGLAVGEVTLVATRSPHPAGFIGAGVLSGAGMLWAAWISAGRDWHYVPGSAYGGTVVGLLASAWWVRTGARRAVHTETS